MDGRSTAASARVAPGRILAVSSFGAFLAFLDATVVNVAFPSIRASFSDASVSDLSWVLNAYNITFASFLIVFGRFADLVGRKRLFSLGTLVFMELEAAGLVVDRVAGCSLGAIVAGCYATGLSAAEVHETAYAEFVRRNPFGDYTLPVTSLSKGQRTAAALRRNLGDGRIEALPREFHCVSTDLLSRTPYVHGSGPLWEAVTASARLPVLFPPMHVDGHMLVDGSVLDNLPAWLLTQRREGPVIAVHIGLGGTPRKQSTPPVDGAPGIVVPRPRVPSLGETLLRTMTIAGGGSTDDARAAGAYLVVPPSMGVGLLEFHQLDRMVEAGRLAARELLEATGGVLQPTH